MLLVVTLAIAGNRTVVTVRTENSREAGLIAGQEQLFARQIAQHFKTDYGLIGRTYMYMAEALPHLLQKARRELLRAT